MVTHSSLQKFLVLLVVCYPLFADDQTQPPQPERPTVYLLAMVHGGKELLSAAQLAVDKINTRGDILTGFNLELVEANSETCNQSLVTEAPVNFVRRVTDGDLKIVGVVGLLCSTVTQAVSPLAGRPGIDRKSVV